MQVAAYHDTLLMMIADDAVHQRRRGRGLACCCQLRAANAFILVMLLPVAGGSSGKKVRSPKTTDTERLQYITGASAAPAGASAGKEPIRRRETEIENRGHGGGRGQAVRGTKEDVRHGTVRYCTLYPGFQDHICRA